MPLRPHGMVWKWHWSDIGLRHKYANLTPKTLRSGITVYLESGIGVVVTQWIWSVHSGVAFECTFGVALEWQWSVPPKWHWSASQICKLTLPCHSSLQWSGKDGPERCFRVWDSYIQTSCSLMGRVEYTPLGLDGYWSMVSNGESFKWWFSPYSRSTFFSKHINNISMYSSLCENGFTNICRTLHQIQIQIFYWHNHVRYRFNQNTTYKLKHERQHQQSNMHSQ